MSGKIATPGGEINFFEEKPLSGTNLADAIAKEIVNEILENALDIATCADETGIPWQEIKNAVAENEVSKDGKNEPEDNSDVCTNIVGDIIQKMGISPTPTISEILDSLNHINQNLENSNKPKMPLQTEMKMLLTEMLTPPYEFKFDTAPIIEDVGDQPFELSKDQLESDVELRKPIEKKLGFTDLVKNSPQIITEYLLVDETAKQNQDEWEEAGERLTQVIELDHVQPDKKYFLPCDGFRPETVPLPDDDDDLHEIPKEEEIISVVELSQMNSKRSKLESPLQADISDISSGAKGDDSQNESTDTLNLPHNTDSCSGEAIIVVADLSEKETKTSFIQKKPKKKKWNIGNRLLNFFKKGSKKQEQSTSVHKSI